MKDLVVCLNVLGSSAADSSMAATMISAKRRGGTPRLFRLLRRGEVGCVDESGMMAGLAGRLAGWFAGAGTAIVGVGLGSMERSAMFGGVMSTVAS